MKRYGDRIQEKASSNGTADFTLAGTVVGWRPFSAITGIEAGDTVVYLAIDSPDWEVGVGTYGTGTLARTTILSSSSGAKVAFTNAPYVVNTLSAEEMASLGTDAVQSVNGQTGVVVLNAGHVGADPVGSASAAEAAAKAASDPVGAAASAQAAAIAASQPRDGDLTALSALSGTGTVRRTGPDAYALDPPVTFPVTSVNTKTGAVTLNASEVGADSSGSAAAAQAAAIAASQPRDGDLTALAALSGTGTVRRTGVDLYTLDPPVTFPVTSVNTKTGAVTLNASEVGADSAGSAAAAQAASQPLDPDLTAIGNLSGIGYLRRTGTNTWVLEEISSSYDPYIYKTASPVTILNTVTETSLFASAITLPGGVLTEDGQVLEILVPIKFTNNSGSNRTVNFKVKLGGVTVFDDSSANFPTATAARVGSFRVRIMRRSPTTGAGGIEFLLSSTTASNAGLGDFAVASTSSTAGFEGAAITWASNTSFDITATLSNATATIQLDTYGALIRK
jgi:hypothetical protein